MRNTMNGAMLRALSATITLAASSALFAQTLPTGQLRIIVPFTPGSATDILGRIAADQLSNALGQKFIVENRPGAGGTIGMAQVANPPADGLTLGVVSKIGRAHV